MSPAKSPPAYADETVRTALATLAARSTVPDNEQLMLVPFRISDTAGLRLVRVVPGVAAQFTDGPKDTIEALDQPQLIIAAAGGGPQQLGDRDQFARNATSRPIQLGQLGDGHGIDPSRSTGSLSTVWGGVPPSGPCREP